MCFIFLMNINFKWPNKALSEQKLINFLFSIDYFTFRQKEDDLQAKQLCIFLDSILTSNFSVSVISIPMNKPDSPKGAVLCEEVKAEL